VFFTWLGLILLKNINIVQKTVIIGLGTGMGKALTLYQPIERIRACSDFGSAAKESKFHFRRGKICSRMWAIRRKF